MGSDIFTNVIPGSQEHMEQFGNSDVVAQFKSQGTSGASTKTNPQLKAGGTQEVSFPR